MDYNKKYWYTSGNGRIEFELTWDQATQGGHQGDCEDDVRALLEQPEIKAIFAAIDPEDIRAELRCFGCWDETELADDAWNRVRLLWTACNDVVEENWKEQQKPEGYLASQLTAYIPGALCGLACGAYRKAKQHQEATSS